VIHEAIMHPSSFPEGHTIINLGLDNPISQLELIKMFEDQSILPLSVPWHVAERRPFEMETTRPDTRLFDQYFAHRLSRQALHKAVTDVIRYYATQQSAVFDTPFLPPAGA
jgi:UDP-glucose 4-epimerase